MCYLITEMDIYGYVQVTENLTRVASQIRGYFFSYNKKFRVMSCYFWFNGSTNPPYWTSLNSQTLHDVSSLQTLACAVPSILYPQPNSIHHQSCLVITTLGNHSFFPSFIIPLYPCLYLITIKCPCWVFQNDYT